MTAALPHFGPTTAPKYKRIPFEFSYLRDEVVEKQTFQLLDKTLDINAANAVLAAATSDTRALPALIGLVTKYMDDKDGTGLRWEPVEVGAKKTEDPPVKRFRGPDGKLHEWAKAETFLRPEAGSSRRRWVQLMEHDDDASVDQEALVKLLEFVVEVGGKDRTRA